MERLRCGVVFTDAFLAHLRAEHGDTLEDEVLAISYVRCADGPRAGESWWSLVRDVAAHFAENDLFEVGEIRVALSRQTQKALKWKYVDYKDGHVIVG